MAKFTPPFAYDGERRSTTSDEQEHGIPCGPFDRPMWHGLFHNMQAELGNLISASGQTDSEMDLSQVAKAVQSGKFSYAVATGTANALTVILNPVPAALPHFLEVKFVATNTGTATIKVNGFDAVPILRFGGAPLQSGDLPQGGVGILTLNDASYYEITSVQSDCYYAIASGSANAMAANLSPSLVAYRPGLTVRIKALASSNTGAATLSIDGLGAKSILRADGSAVQSNDILANSIFSVTYDGSAWRLQTPTAAFERNWSRSGSSTGKDGSASGYIILPGNMILNYWRNIVTNANASGEASIGVPFAMSFPNFVLGITSVAVNEANASNRLIVNSYAPNLTTGIFHFSGAGAGNPVASSGFAIGY